MNKSKLKTSGHNGSKTTSASAQAEGGAPAKGAT